VIQPLNLPKAVLSRHGDAHRVPVRQGRRPRRRPCAPGSQLLTLAVWPRYGVVCWAIPGTHWGNTEKPLEVQCICKSGVA
jgi:hypothetical protein